jgi:serine/threonine-protein kinase
VYPDDDRPTVDLGPRPATDEIVTPEPIDPTEPLGPDQVHVLPTQQLPRRRASTNSLTRYSTTTSPVEAMRLDEIARTRVFLKVALFTSVAGAIAAMVTSGDPIAFWVVIGGCIVTAVGAAMMLAVTADPSRYSPRTILPSALVIAVGAFAGVYYWGVASPVAAMIVFGIYFFSLGADARITTSMYALVAGLHLLLGLAVATGMMADRGIINMSRLSTQDQLITLSVIEFLYLITFITARISQRVTLQTVSKLEQAVRSVAQREAMLAEARAELDRALKVGGPGRFTEQVVGNFRLGVLIGRGGMGEVYEAHAVTDRREAAVKLLHPGTLGDPTSVQRFLREAQTAARLDSDHVVRVLEVGTTASEIPFLAMERLRGHDLAHQLRRQRRLQLQQTRTLVDQIAAGLEAARSAGIVHRDLKPHNLFYAEHDGHRCWKILDFGVSKSGGSGGTLTQGHVVGTPAYMAPEQARGEDVDHRADVYSLAAIIFRTLTGHPAFTGKDVPTTLYDVVYRIPTQPSILAALPADVDRILAIGLAKDPKDRFETGVELAAWFAAAITGELRPEQRRRADDLISRQPWGTRTGVA